MAISRARLVLVVLLALISVLPAAACTGSGQAGRAAATPGGPATIVAPLRGTDYTQFVDNDQGPGQVFLRYPLGRIGLWSTPDGEIADSVTRGVMLYPTVDQVTDKGTADWRAAVAATPQLTTISYQRGSPAQGSAVQLTVTPDVAVYRYRFAPASRYDAVNVLMQQVQDSNVTWSASTFRYLSASTAEVILSDGRRGGQRAYFYLWFSTPAAGHGTFTPGQVSGGRAAITGEGVGGYLAFKPGTTVTVAVALSMTSMARAERNFRTEFAGTGFAAAVSRLKSAWNAKLGRVEVTRASPLTARQVYTGLYTLYANIVDVTDNPDGYRPLSPSTRLLTIGSSVWWEQLAGGYFRCSFDQGRNVYAFLTLIDPAVMRDVLNTYLAQAARDEFLMGNWDPYDPSAWSGQQWGFFGWIFLGALLEGVTGVDYRKAEQAILDTMGKTATSRYVASTGYYRYGYVPANVGTTNYLSRGLEFATDLAGLAHLAYALGDTATYDTYAPYATAYQRTWNPAAGIFQARNTDGSWAQANAGLFEGDTASYAFDEPQDGPGLAAIYGDSAMAADLAASYARPDVTYNDYQLTQPYLATEADSPATAQRIIRDYFLPEFDSLTMWESPPRGGSVFYTDNASAVVLANLGLYPLQSPGAAWVLNSPAVAAAVIHGRQDTVIEAEGDSSATPYVRSISVNGAPYPSEFISGETLAAHATTLSFKMSRTPARIARSYVTATTAEIVTASTDGRGWLNFRADPLAPAAQVLVSAPAAPRSITVNGRPLSAADWSYSLSQRMLTLKNLPGGVVQIR
jgi:putative alpha-1,2-mannosidase